MTEEWITKAEYDEAVRTITEIGDPAHQAWIARYYKPDRLDGRGERYAAIVRASHATCLAKDGYDLISGHDSVTGTVAYWPDEETAVRFLLSASRQRERAPQMFPNQDDLPLFSGAAQAAHPATPTQARQPNQPGLFACRFCQDTGRVTVNGKRHFCSCPAGLRARAVSKDLS